MIFITSDKEKKMIQRYCIYPKIAVVALIFSFVQCALIVPLEMIDDLVFQNKGFQPTVMFTALGFVVVYVVIFCFCALAPKFRKTYIEEPYSGVWKIPSDLYKSINNKDKLIVEYED